MAETSDRLPVLKRLSYGVGHVLNDLCGAMWFSYMILFFQNVVSLSSSMAGYLLLMGHAAAALSTPLIGYESDRTRGFGKYGKRKSWHLIGTICVLCTLPFMFMPVLGTQKADDWAKMIYYGPFVVVFVVGWSAVQISHLALIPDLATKESHRIELNAIRYGFLVISNITVYAVTWVLLGFGEENKTRQLGPKDAPMFRNLALIICGSGLIFTVIFHVGVKESIPRDDKENKTLKKPEKRRPRMSWWCWFKELQFYQIAFLYVCTRLIFNLSQVYLPLFLTSSLHLHKTYIATIPLTVYVSGFAVSLLMKVVNRLVGRKVTYLLGALLVGGASCWLWFSRQGAEWQIFMASALLGAGSSTILVTSLAMMADLIGNRTESGAFVYGLMSFVDMLSCGLAISMLQQFHPCKAAECCDACVWYYRNIIVILPGTLSALAIIVVLTLHPRSIKQPMQKHSSSKLDCRQEMLLGDPENKPAFDQQPNTDKTI